MIGDQANYISRMRAAMPSNWFPTNAPALTGILAGFGKLYSIAYSNFMFAKAQMRLPTTVGIWLDLAAWDFFGPSFTRKAQAAYSDDTTFANAIVTQIFKVRVTRAAVLNAVTDASATSARCFEAWRVQDTGARGTPLSGYGAYGAYGGRRVNRARAYLDVIRPRPVSASSFGGYGAPTVGYGAPTIGYAAFPNEYAIQAPVFNAINDTKPLGITVWVKFDKSSITDYYLADPSGNLLTQDNGYVVDVPASLLGN